MPRTKVVSCLVETSHMTRLCACCGDTIVPMAEHVAVVQTFINDLKRKSMTHTRHFHTGCVPKRLIIK